MKFVKWAAVFVVAFIVAWILIFTFIQEPFKQTAAARILKWWTPAIPIYLYVVGAFVGGLMVGLGVAVFNYVTLQAKVHHYKKEYKTLEVQYGEANARAKQFEMDEPPETEVSQLVHSPTEAEFEKTKENEQSPVFDESEKKE